MNRKISESKYGALITEKDLITGLNAIDKKCYDMPPEYYPVDYYAKYKTDPWKKLPDRKYMEDLPFCLAKWNIILSLSRRIRKLEQKRILDSDYCNRSNRNIEKITAYYDDERKKGHHVYFI